MEFDEIYLNQIILIQLIIEITFNNNNYFCYIVLK